MVIKADIRHRYGELRWKSFYLLSQVDDAITVRQWAYYAGVPFHSLQTQATRWARFHYISRIATPSGYAYTLLRKGRAWSEDGYLLAGIRRAPLLQEIYDYQERVGLLQD
jgi:hypothetical protein